MARLKVWYLVKGQSNYKVVEEEDRKLGFLDTIHSANLVVQFRKPDGSWGPVAGRFLREEKYYSPFRHKARKAKRKKKASRCKCKK